MYEMLSAIFGLVKSPAPDQMPLLMISLSLKIWLGTWIAWLLRAMGTLICNNMASQICRRVGKEIKTEYRFLVHFREIAVKKGAVSDMQVAFVNGT